MCFCTCKRDPRWKLQTRLNVATPRLPPGVSPLWAVFVVASGGRTNKHRRKGIRVGWTVRSNIQITGWAGEQTKSSQNLLALHYADKEHVDLGVYIYSVAYWFYCDWLVEFLPILVYIYSWILFFFFIFVWWFPYLVSPALCSQSSVIISYCGDNVILVFSPLFVPAF